MMAGKVMEEENGRNREEWQKDEENDTLRLGVP